jgi:hypothetical protein
VTVGDMTRRDTIEIPIPKQLAKGVIVIDGAAPRQCQSASELQEMALESGQLMFKGCTKYVFVVCEVAIVNEAC